MENTNLAFRGSMPMQHLIHSNGPLVQLPIPCEVSLKVVQGYCLCATGSLECVVIEVV